MAISFPFAARRRAAPCAIRTLAAGLLVAAAAAAGPAWGANADVTVTVTAVPDSVSVSRAAPAPLSNYAAYAVTVSNATSNVINQVLFGGSASVVGGSSAATFVESIPAGLCTATTSASTISCNVGQLRGRADFIVIFRAPLDGSQINFDHGGTYSNGASPTTPSSNYPLDPGQVVTGLTTNTDTLKRSQLRTFVPPAGGTFFTGDNATALEVDVSTTRISAPPGLGLRQAVGVTETVEVGGLTNDTTHRFSTQISMPVAPGSYLAQVVTFELHRDASTIRAFNKIDRVPLLYTSDAGEPWQVADQALPGCGDLSFYPVGPGPSAVFPVCVDQRIGVRRNMVGQAAPGGGTYTLDDVGDWIFVIRALQNGKTSW